MAIMNRFNYQPAGLMIFFMKKLLFFAVLSQKWLESLESRTTFYASRVHDRPAMTRQLVDLT